VNEFYEGQQFVGMDLHRRRSVLVRMTETSLRLASIFRVAGSVRTGPVLVGLWG
jgi:hypothetical protein